MKKFIATVLSGLLVAAGLGSLAALTMADAQAQNRAPGARGHAAGARPHVSGVRSHVTGVRGHTFHRGARVGVFVGGAIVTSPWCYHPDPYPYYYGYGPYYYPPAIYVQEQPTVYVEAPAPPIAALPAPQEQYWYYCQDSKTYYPYVQTCATPWRRVIPHAPQ